jgi:hypothetical protein
MAVEKQLNDSQYELFQESKIRGLCAAISADMEALLFRLILYCTIDDPAVVYRDFSKITLKKKIKWAERDIQTHYNEKYKLIRNEFEPLRLFNEFRGRLIHCDIIWKDQTYNEFSVLDIQKIDGEWRIVPIIYTKQQVVKRLAEFGKQIVNFAHITKDIIAIVEKKHPELKTTTATTNIISNAG